MSLETFGRKISKVTRLGSEKQAVAEFIKQNVPLPDLSLSLLLAALSSAVHCQHLRQGEGGGFHDETISVSVANSFII